MSDYVTIYRELEDERALADDLADVLGVVTTDEHAHITRTGQLPEVRRVLARYRKARGR